MAIAVSGELLRLLIILSARPQGATQRELTILAGVKASLIYRAVVLNLVYAKRQDTAYRYHLLDAGRALLSPDESGTPCGD